MGKKQKKKTTKKEVNKKKAEGLTIEISKTRTDIQSFLEKFKADVARKTKKYRKYVQEARKKSKSVSNFETNPKTS